MLLLYVCVCVCVPFIEICSHTWNSKTLRMAFSASALWAHWTRYLQCGAGVLSDAEWHLALLLRATSMTSFPYGCVPGSHNLQLYFDHAKCCLESNLPTCSDCSKALIVTQWVIGIICSSFQSQGSHFSSVWLGPLFWAFDTSCKLCCFT